MSTLVLGNVRVETTNMGGHDAAFYAERLVEKLISVGDSLPEPIKAQAIAYKQSIEILAHHVIASAMRSERTTISAKLRQADMPEAARLVERM